MIHSFYVLIVSHLSACSCFSQLCCECNQGYSVHLMLFTRKVSSLLNCKQYILPGISIHHYEYLPHYYYVTMLTMIRVAFHTFPQEACAMTLEKKLNAGQIEEVILQVSTTKSKGRRQYQD